MPDLLYHLFKLLFNLSHGSACVCSQIIDAIQKIHHIKSQPVYACFALAYVPSRSSDRIMILHTHKRTHTPSSGSVQCYEWGFVFVWVWQIVFRYLSSIEQPSSALLSSVCVLGCSFSFSHVLKHYCHIQRWPFACIAFLPMHCFLHERWSNTAQNHIHTDVTHTWPRRSIEAWLARWNGQRRHELAELALRSSGMGTERM